MSWTVGATTRRCSNCGERFTPLFYNQRFCRTVCRERKLGRTKRARHGTTAERGYTGAHKRERERWKPLVDRGEATCCRCGLPLAPGAAFHLDHDDNDRTRYRGVAHPACNVRAGAVKGNRQRRSFTSSAPRIAR